MANARKLPSGNYRCRVYVGKENGKDVYKSFTAPKKTLAENMASQYLLDLEKKQRNIRSEKTFSEALADYISIKEAVLSPSTIAGYKSLEKRFLKNYPGFCKMKLSDITQEDVQKLISDLSRKSSPKTVRNFHGLISSTLGKELMLNTTMPQKIEPNLYIPTDDDIKKLVNAVKGTEIEIPVLLGAFCLMRRGEICGLSMEDIKGNTIHVHHSLVMGSDNQYHLKAPKNNSSDRYINVPDFVIDKINEKGYITKLTPNAITSMLHRILKSNNIPLFRFHDLRHYSASIRHALNIPDAYIMAEGGWKTDTVLKSVYRHALKDKANEMQDRANNHFSQLYDTNL